MTKAMTLSQGYRQVQAARCKPYLDYPYLSIPDEDEEDVLDRIQY